MVSSLLSSSTVGGGSWLAHATLLTGVRIENQLDFGWITRTEPKGLVHYFREAGYRTLTVEPATKRIDPTYDLFKFEQRLSYADFGYRGPRFGWAPMPDQFVLDFVHRKKVTRGGRPWFIKYALVSSHAPWSVQPQLVEDWSNLQQGLIYKELTPVTFPTGWSELSEAHGAYMRSIEYSMEVTRQYLERFLLDNSLVILLGDHQPTGDVTGHSADKRVPLHVLSRNCDFMVPFLKRGYVQGMTPDLNATEAGLETFAPNLVSDFSEPATKATPAPASPTESTLGSHDR
jgi:hypothetical protein